MPLHNYPAAALMLELLKDSAITIQLGDLGANILGEVDFATRVVTINRAVTTAQFRATLTHELVHLVRGPCYEGQEEEEEAIVATETAMLMAPPGLIPRQADPKAVADAFGVDESLAALAISIARVYANGVA